VRALRLTMPACGRRSAGGRAFRRPDSPSWRHQVGCRPMRRPRRQERRSMAAGCRRSVQGSRDARGACTQAARTTRGMTPLAKCGRFLQERMDPIDSPHHVGRQVERRCGLPVRVHVVAEILHQFRDALPLWRLMRRVADRDRSVAVRPSARVHVLDRETVKRLERRRAQPKIGSRGLVDEAQDLVELKEAVATLQPRFLSRVGDQDWRGGLRVAREVSPSCRHERKGPRRPRQSSPE
jgi:hypothetical protein